MTAPGDRKLWFYQLLIGVVLGQSAVLAIRFSSTYRVLALGGTAVEAGLVTSSFALIALVVAIPLGRLSDRRSPATFIPIGAGITVASALICAWADSVLWVGIGQALLGLGHILVVAGSQGVMAARTPAARRPGWFGWYTFSASVGQFLGPTGASLLLSSESGSRASPVLGDDVVVFLSGAILAAGALAATAKLGGHSEQPPSVASHVPRSGIRGIVAAAPIRAAIVASMVISATNDILVAYLPVYAVHAQIPVSTVGLMVGAYGLSSVVGRLWLAQITARLGMSWSRLWCLAIPAVAILLVPITDENAIRVVSMSILGLFLGVGQPITLVSVVNLAPERERGSALAVRTASVRGVQFVAPTVAGAVAGMAGAGATFIVLGALLAATAAFDLTALLRQGRSEAGRAS